jgi:hypothetical protein
MPCAYVQRGSQAHGTFVASHPIVLWSSWYRIHNEIRVACVWAALLSSNSGRDFPRGAVQTQRFNIRKGALQTQSQVVGCDGEHRRVQDCHAGPGLLIENHVVSPLVSVLGGRRGESYRILAEWPLYNRQHGVPAFQYSVTVGRFECPVSIAKSIGLRLPVRLSPRIW